MYRIILPLLISGFITITFADSATQTDWSGGPGLWIQEVLDWNEYFYSESCIQFHNPGMLCLLYTENTVDGDYNGAYSVYSEDFDGDGDMDVLGSSLSDDDINWWENADGSGTNWIKHTIDDDFNCSWSVYSEDVDGDGNMDVLGASRFDDDITWWENADGSGTSWIEHTVDGEYNEPRSLYSEDVDGDGDMDVLGAAFKDDDITWWENADGSGTSWIERTVDGDFDSPRSVYSEDLDGDGDMDVLGAASGDDYITWWENVDGSGTSWTEHIIDVDFYTPYSVYSADVNGDGNMDVLATAYADDEISWWNLTLFPPAGSLESSCLYLRNDPGWGSILWTSTEPSGTSVSFQLRACDSPDSTEMGAWSDTLHSPCSLSGILNEYDSFFQYRVILQTSDSCITPVLEDVTITWNPVGIDDGEANALQLLSVVPNPTSGSPVVRISLPATGTAKLAVFDLSGRIVQEIQEDEYSSGYSDIQLDELSPGIYFCRMIAEEFTATQRFVVLE